MRTKLFLSLVFFTVFSAVVFFGFYSSAENLSFEQKFLARGDKKNMGVSGAYNFDRAHSSIGFRVKHIGLVDVPGYFRDFTGKINYDASDVAKSSVEFSAKMTSVDTGVAGRDNHLRSKDFFEVETFPEMTFKSTKITKKGKGWMMTGDLTMKGVTKSITFPFNVVGFVKDERSGGTKMGAVAETSINRREFNVNYGGNMPNGVPVLSDNITVVLNIEANLPALKPENK
jgi:polyisoprenoid-binding protein YceI